MHRRRLVAMLIVVLTPVLALVTAEDAPNVIFQEGAVGLDACRRHANAQQRELDTLRRRVEAITSTGAEALGETLDVMYSRDFYRHATCAFLCVCLAALAAGLTMGLVSIEPMEMKIIVNTEDKDMVAEKDKFKLKEDQAAARKVLPLIHDHHRLLVTLLLMNSIANEALPLFLDRLVPSWLAVAFSVSLVLVFGEIIPSAIFTGSNQLRIAAMFAPMVACCQFLLTPIALPIAKILDRILGEDHKGRYNFAKLRAIVSMHAELKTEGPPSPAVFKCVDDHEMGIITTEGPHHFSDETVVIFTSVPNHPAKSTKLQADQLYYVKTCEPLVGRGKTDTFRVYSREERDVKDAICFKKGEIISGAFIVQERDEIKIMRGVMKLTHMSASESYKPLSETDMLECGQWLTKDTLEQILEKGHSRIPVYCDNKHNVRGLVLTKKMILISPDGGSKVSDIDISPMVLVRPDIRMLDLLNKFQAERCHMALICSHPDRVQNAWQHNQIIPPDIYMMGIITLEDVIEKLIQEDIFDEHDEKTPHWHSQYLTPRVNRPERHPSPGRWISLTRESDRGLTVQDTRTGSKRLVVPAVPSSARRVSEARRTSLEEPLLGATKQDAPLLGAAITVTAPPLPL